MAVWASELPQLRLLTTSANGSGVLGSASAGGIGFVGSNACGLNDTCVVIDDGK